jgi:transposase
MLTKGVVLLPTTRGPTLRLALRLYSSSSTGRFSNTSPPYSPDLAPSDYHLFTYMKVWLANERFKTNEELMDGVKNWLGTLAAPFCYE